MSKEQTNQKCEYIVVGQDRSDIHSTWHSKERATSEAMLAAKKYGVSYLVYQCIGTAAAVHSSTWEPVEEES